MSVYSKIEELLPEMSKNERKVADHILKYPYDLQRFSGESIGAACNVSRSAVIRFCHKLGFTGFSDFREAMLKEPFPSRDIPSSGTNNQVLGIYAKCLSELDRTINHSDVDMIADLIIHANQTVTFGLYHSGMSAEQLSFRLVRQNIISHSIKENEAIRLYSKFLKQGDVAVIFSLTGQDFYLDLIRAMRQNRVIVILITMNPNTLLSRYVDYTLLCPSAVYSSSSYLLDDAICFYLMIEVLIEAIVRKLHFTSSLAEEALQ